MSIQLKLGGHSFSCDNLNNETIDSSQIVECLVITAKTTLVPIEAFDPAIAARYLAINGQACSEDEVAVFSDVTAPIVAVMAVESKCFSALHERFGDRVVFTTPLLDERKHSQPHIKLFRSGQIIYINIYGEDLRFAEALIAPKDEDALWYLTELTNQMNIKDYTLYITGDRSKDAYKLLRRYFRRVVCE